MELVSNILLVLSAVVSGTYCHVLAGRIKKLHDLKGGLGATILTLARQVDELEASIKQAKIEANAGVASLENTCSRAVTVAQRLELLMASMHDIEDIKAETPKLGNSSHDPFYAKEGYL